jgi:hypothetical protein
MRYRVLPAWMCVRVCESVDWSYGACCEAWHVVVFSHDSDDGCWCVHGGCACLCCDWAVAGCAAVWAVLTRVLPGLTWTGPRAGADVFTGVA